MIKLDRKAEKQLHKGIRMHSKQIRKILQANNPIEEESIFLIRDLLKDAFGYGEDALSSQTKICGKRADITVHYSLGDIVCEGKRYNAQKSLLDESAKKQLYRYCSCSKCEWGILTDGIRWEFYWFPLKQKEGKKFAGVDFVDLKDKISLKYCKRFNIFHADVKNRQHYVKTQEMISAENIRVWLREEKVFNVLCGVIKNKLHKKTAEINELKPLIYKHFADILPLPKNRNNPYDPLKKKQRKSRKIIVSADIENKMENKQ